MTNQTVKGESDAGSAGSSKRRIQKNESDFKSRLLEAINGESISSFSRRCGAGESLLRGYLKQGNKPGVDHLIAIADAANVNIEWLAAGRGPKQRGTSVPTIPQAPPIPPTVFHIDDIHRLTPVHLGC